MTFGEAIDKLEDAAIFDKYGYSLKIKAVRKEKRIWMIQTIFGLAQCTHDWPVPYTPSMEDLNAIDWEIEND